MAVEITKGQLAHAREIGDHAISCASLVWDWDGLAGEDSGIPCDCYLSWLE